MKKIDINTELLIINEYKINPCLKNVAAKFDKSTETIIRVLKLNNIIIQKRSIFGNTFNILDIPNIIKFYLEGNGITSCSNKYHTGYYNVRKILIENNITIRTHEEATKVHKCQKEKYHINESFFENPENWDERQAWTLGWYGSDGNNYSPKNSFFIKLQARDKIVLDYIKSFLEYEGPMIYRDNKNEKTPCQPTWNLQIRNEKISKDLYSLGIVDNKSLILEFPKFLRQDLIRHYIRGYFEGDGCISKVSKDKSTTVNQIGTREFLDYHNFILNQQIGIRFKTIHLKTPDENHKWYNGVTSYYNISDRRELYKLYHYLYDNAQYFLPRKKERWDNFIDLLISSPNYQDLNPYKV